MALSGGFGGMVLPHPAVVPALATAPSEAAQRGTLLAVAASPPYHGSRWRTHLGPVGIVATSAFTAGAIRWCGTRRGRGGRLTTTSSGATATAVAPTRASATSEDQWFESLRETTAGRFDEALSDRGLASLSELDAPSRQQEAWRYTDLQALLYGVGADAAVAPRTPEALRSLVVELLEDHQASSSSSSSPLPSPPCSRLVFVDGELSEEFSLLAADLETGTFASGARALKAEGDGQWQRVKEMLTGLPEVNIFPEAGEPRNQLGCAKLAAFNQSLFKDCACIRLEGRESADSQEDELPRIEVVFITTCSAGATVASPRLLVEVGARRKLHLVETHVSLDPSDASLSNGVCRVVVSEGAVAKHELLQQKADDSRFVESVTAEVHADAEYSCRVVQTGGRAARVNVAISLAGSSSACELTGVSVAAEKEQYDLHSFIHHIVPSCRSKQTQKNIVANSAECIFKGKIQVDKKAQQTSSEQLCRSLLVSKKARVKAMPLLQIQADDVVCSHGAAVTELDRNQVFYLKSRGLSGQESRKLLLQAFPQDLLSGLQAAAPKAHQRVLEKLTEVADSAEVAD